MSVISPEAFNTLEAVIQREVKLLKLKNPRSSLNIKAKKLIQTLRDELDIITSVQSLIFENFSSLKELEQQEKERKAQQKVRDEQTQHISGLHKSVVESEESFNQPLHRIKVFNQIKKVLLRMTRSNGMISLSLVQGIIQDLRN